MSHAVTRRLVLAVLLLGSALGAPAGAPAQDGTTEPRTYGPTATIAHVFNAFAFQPLAGVDAPLFGVAFAGARFCTSACASAASLSLPAGARVTAIELEACDTTAAGRVRAALERYSTPEAAAEGLALAETGPDNSSTPGCGLFSGPLVPPHTIDNIANNYAVRVIINGTNSQTRFHAVRVFYQLQVSVAPATATFGDVPTSHPFFQFVEALVASGITVGCGGGNYCPDAPLTRGQMAVFLGKALGLHFAP
jgi:hypothetical protein